MSDNEKGYSTAVKVVGVLTTVVGFLVLLAGVVFCYWAVFKYVGTTAGISMLTLTIQLWTLRRQIQTLRLLKQMEKRTAENRIDGLAAKVAEVVQRARS
jgi:hypothetical protein